MSPFRSNRKVPRTRVQHECAGLPVHHGHALLAQEPGLKPQDLFINLVEVVWENWSFGNGKSQYTE